MENHLILYCLFQRSKGNEITSPDKNNKSILSSEVSNIEVLKISNGNF
jgi:hypothetical protein